MSSRILRFCGALALIAASGCGASTPTPPPKPPGVPPTPATVTRKNPGGDAADPEKAALERLLKEPWGGRGDRYATMRAPLVDWSNWRRVKLVGHPTRAAFRYGDEHYGVAGVWYIPAKGANDPDTCLAQFMSTAVPQAEAYGARMGETRVLHAEQQVKGELRPMTIRTIDGGIESMFASDDYAGALVSYQSWPGTCLIYGFAVVAGHHKELARKVRDRWITEGAPKLQWNKVVAAAPSFDAW